MKPVTPPVTLNNQTTDNQCTRYGSQSVTQKPWLSTTFRVGKRTVILAIERPERGDYGMQLEHVEWRPSMPKRLTKKEWRQYRAGRDAMTAEAADPLGLRIAVAELDVIVST